MTTPTVYLETMGCQMNVLDSELVLGQLRARGWTPVPSMDEAQLVLFNTCSVRDHAEQKALSRLGALRKRKMADDSLLVGVIGCMAERDPDGVLAKMPHVDLVCGPGDLNKIPALIDEIRESKSTAVAVSSSQSRKSTPLQRSLEYDSVEAIDLARDPSPEANVLQSYIRIQRGCDKFCTFCVVPFTRGPERSRPPQQIVDEAKMLADRGAREVTLLGQTVNSYIHLENGKTVRLADLLCRVAEVRNIERVRFVTSYPGDFTDDIFEAMRDVPEVCEYLHLPVQSGSDAVLQRMRRQYSIGAYREVLERGRELVPNLSVATDFIVGFSGETEAEHQASVQLIEQCAFKNIFVFKYSERPATVAAKRMIDDVPDEIKRRRNAELLEAQASSSWAQKQDFLGRTVEVLVEGYSKAAIKAQQSEQDRGEEMDWRRSDQLVGRTTADHIVVFPGSGKLVGRFARIKITAATALTLHGTFVADSADPQRASLPAHPASIPVLTRFNANVG